jgi:hypothetical protein
MQPVAATLGRGGGAAQDGTRGFRLGLGPPRVRALELELKQTQEALAGR